MPEVSLSVTRKVLAQLEAGNAFQSQIAIRDATEQLAEQVAAASARNIVELRLGGILPLRLGDTGALWRTHQNSSATVEAFDRLFNLLALNPDQWLRFRW